MRDKTNRRIVWLLVLIILLTASGILYLSSFSTDRYNDSYTEFYVLGPDGGADDYPTTMVLGETGEVIVGITNNEHQEMDYTVLMILGEPTEKRTVSLDSGKNWEARFTFTPEEAGEQELEILLFQGESVESVDDPYRELQLQIQVNDT